MARITEYGVKGDLYNRLQMYDKSKGLLAAALLIDSNLPAGQSELYAWLGTTASMRQWIGARLVATPNAFNYQIQNKKYENSMQIGLDLIKNDKVQQCDMLISSLASSYPLWMIETIAALVNTGTSALCFDGLSFFNGAHSFARSGSFSNAANSASTGGTQAGVSPLTAATAINLAIELMKAFPDDQGRVIKNEMMSKVVLAYQAGTVNASAIRTALNTVNDGILASGTGSVNNPLTGQDVAITAVASGLLTTTNLVFSMFRHRDDLGKGIIFQENKDELLNSIITDASSEYVVFNDAWFVGLKTVGNAGFGLPNDAIQITFVA